MISWKICDQEPLIRSRSSSSCRIKSSLSSIVMVSDCSSQLTLSAAIKVLNSKVDNHFPKALAWLSQKSSVKIFKILFKLSINLFNQLLILPTSTLILTANHKPHISEFQHHFDLKFQHLNMSSNGLKETPFILPNRNPIDLLDNRPGSGRGKAAYLPNRCNFMIRSLAVKTLLKKVALSL